MRDRPADGREHLCSNAALAGELEHIAAVGKVAKAMHRAGGHVHKGTGLADYGLARAGEFDFARDNIEGLVPVMTMRRRTHSALALLPRDFLGLCCGI